MNLKQTFTSLLILLTFNVFSQSGFNLEIHNPQEWWSNSDGIISNVNIDVAIQDLHAKVDLYMDFSAPTNQFNSEEQLEVVLDFKLPEDAIITDSWLYIEDYISKAYIIDRWFANQIYEEIVDRREDPSILFKNGENQYNLKIYPMMGDSSRRIKLEYLTPLTINRNGTSFELPIDILNSSLTKNTLQTKVSIKANDDFGVPSIIGNEEVTPELVNSNYIFEESSFMNTDWRIQLASPLENDVYICNYTDDLGQSYYNLAYQIPNNTEVQQQNIVLVFDLTDDNSRIDNLDLIDDVFDGLQQSLLVDDKFNVVFSSLFPIVLFDDFQEVSLENLQTAKTEIKENIDKFSNLPTNLATAIDFINEKDVPSKIVLISNSGNHGEGIISTNITNQLITFMEDGIYPIYIIDLLQRNIESNYVNGIYYRGNEYLYDQLTRLTFGEYFNIGLSQLNYTKEINDYISNSYPSFQNYELHIDVQDGFTYHKYSNIENNGILKPNQLITQIGKYVGELPFELEFTALYDGEVLHDFLFIEAEDIKSCTEGLPQIHVGRQLDELEHQSFDNQIAQDIIDLSINNRVLSTLTAFLCLEEDFEFTPGEDEENDTSITATEDFDEGQISSFIASPNPFVNQTNLTLTIEDYNFNDNDVSIQIIDAFGRVINVIEEFDINAKTLEFSWITDQSIMPGIYYCQVLIGNKRISKKLLKISA